MVQVFPLSKQQTWELLKELSSIVLLSVKFQTLNVLDGPYLRNLPIKSLNLKSYLLVNWPLTLMYIVPPKFTRKLDISFLWKSFPKSPTPRHPGATETEVWYFWDPKKQTHKITVHLRRYSPGSLGYTPVQINKYFLWNLRVFTPNHRKLPQEPNHRKFRFKLGKSSGVYLWRIFVLQVSLTQRLPGRLPDVPLPGLPDKLQGPFADTKNPMKTTCKADLYGID